MDNMWDAIRKGLQDGATVAMNKAEELTQLGRARLDVAAVKTRKSRLQEELGVAVFQLMEADKAERVAGDAKVRDLCDGIRAAAEELASSEAAFVQLKEDLTAASKPDGRANGEEDS